MKVVLKFSPPTRRYPYRGRRRMLRALGRRLAEMTIWTATDAHRRTGVVETFDHTAPADQFAHTSPIYDLVLDRTKPSRMLTIGNFYEDSLRVWQEYLHRDSFVVSADVDSKLLKIADSRATYVRICDEQASSTLRDIAEEYGPFDVIVDEGGRTTSHVVNSFRCLFSDALTETGVYITKGVNLDYQKSHRDSRVSFIDLVKALIDAMHAHHQTDFVKNYYGPGHPERLTGISVPAITPLLGNIEIYDSIVIVRRAKRKLHAVPLPPTVPE